MRFLSIELENFRQYREKQEIAFSFDVNKNFTIIQAPNGAGKTNLLSAIYWCFYGDEENKSSKYKETKTLNVLSESSSQSLPKGERAKVAVKITLGEDIAEYVLERTNIFEKDSSGSIHMIDDTFKILTYHDGGFKEEQNIELAINRILPKEVKNFFFFDGEKLDAFFRIGSGTNIKKAVYDVSQIGLLNNTIKHLEVVKKDIMKNYVDVNPQIRSKQKDIEEREKALNENKEDRTRLQKEIEEANNEINNIDEFLREHSIPQVKDKQKQREFYETRFKENLTRIEDLNKNRVKALLNLSPLILSQSSISNFIHTIERLDKEKSLPPDISNSALRKILMVKKCICGTNIEKESEEEKTISKLIKKEDFGDNVQLILEGRSELEYATENICSYNDQLKEFHDEIDKLRTNNLDIKNSLEEIRLQLEGVNVDEVQRKESQRTGLFNNVQKSNQNFALCSSNILDLEEDLKDKTRELAKLVGKKSESAEFGLQIELFDESLEVVNDILNEIVEEVRNTIQIKTNEYFLNLIWKKGAYKQVKIDVDYNLSVTNKYGSECLGSLSAGERQVLALSFMAALKEVSGFNIPVVIDTPLGRISGEPRENIAKSLPSYLRDTQVTLLMTDTEYTGKLKSILKDRVGKEYEIKFNEETGESKVI
jgi:DNA sulfur modification protein DndD